MTTVSEQVERFLFPQHRNMTVSFVDKMCRQHRLSTWSQFISVSSDVKYNIYTQSPMCTAKMGISTHMVPFTKMSWDIDDTSLQTHYLYRGKSSALHKSTLDQVNEMLLQGFCGPLEQTDVFAWFTPDLDKARCFGYPSVYLPNSLYESKKGLRVCVINDTNNLLALKDWYARKGHMISQSELTEFGIRSFLRKETLLRHGSLLLKQLFQELDLDGWIFQSVHDKYDQEWCMIDCSKERTMKHIGVVCTEYTALEWSRMEATYKSKQMMRESYDHSDRSDHKDGNAPG